MQTITAKSLVNNNFAELEKSVTTVESILDRPPLVMLAKVIDAIKIETCLAEHLFKVQKLINVDARLNLQPEQIPVIAEMLISTFPNESLEDFILCFRRGAMGLYDEKLLRVDGSVITHWMISYLDQKYQAVETKLMQEKDKHGYEQTETAKDPDSWLKLWMESIGYKPQETNNEKANEFERKKIAYVPPSPEEVKKRELHLRWINENFDPISGKPLAGFKEEQTWLLDN